MKMVGRLFLGIVAGNVAGVLLSLAAAWLVSHTTGMEGVIILPNLMIVPFVMGLVSAWIWGPLNMERGNCILNTFISSIFSLGTAAVFLREGAICLIIVFPVLFLFELAGSLAGRTFFRSNRNNLHLGLVPLAAMLTVGEPFLRTPERNVVTDEILIHAPPAKVWPQVTSFPEISAAPNFWLFRLGLPKPMATAVEGDFVGANRQCIFSGGAVFKETVAEIRPRELLTFDIVESPKDPELVGHLTAERGQFELRDNHDGTTTLIGRTWYQLHVRPLWYFDWWTQHIFKAVHLRVMENVREKAEATK